MKSIVKIEDIPSALPIEQLMEVKGGLLDGISICSIFGNGVKCPPNQAAVTCSGEGSGVQCNVAGSGKVCATQGTGVCTVEGSGITCTVAGSGTIPPCNVKEIGVGT